jgi:hypothetical protein
MRLSNRMLMGMVAGAVGTTMLNVVTYLDLAMRGRPPSELPEKVVDELSNKLISRWKKRATTKWRPIGALPLGHSWGLFPGWHGARLLLRAT